MAKDSVEYIKRCALIGLTEHQISYVLQIPLDVIESQYLKLIEENLPADYMEKRKKRFYKAFPKRKMHADYNVRKLCPTFRIESNVRSLLSYHLKKANVSKTDRTFPLLGYTSYELMDHIERQFVEGMTWENYGKVWHLDHIRPASWFTYKTTEDEEFKKCWSLDNLQPLFAKDNLSKGNRWEG